MMPMTCIFCRIIAGEIPGSILYRDDQVTAFNDARPIAPVHVLVIPKKPLLRLAEAGVADQALLGHLLLTAAALAKQLCLAQGYRVVINNGPHGGESVPHLHVHLLGQRPMAWPPG